MSMVPSSTFTEMPTFDRASLDSSPEDPSKDLGFGSEVARGSHKRLLNRDGSFNVERYGLTPFSSLSIYHWSLSTSWPRFLGMLAVAYLCVNTVFALATSSAESTHSRESLSLQRRKSSCAHFFSACKHSPQLDMAMSLQWAQLQTCWSRWKLS